MAFFSELKGKYNFIIFFYFINLIVTLPLKVEEPSFEYDLLRPEDIAEPLYNIHIMVSEFKKLRKRVDQLENGSEEE